MAWKNHGLIFDPAVSAPNIHSHAQVPTPLVMSDRVRVFYAGRNAQGKSFITFADFERDNLTKIIYSHQNPIVSLGKVGSFDDDGMMPNEILSFQGKIYLFYTGWNQRVTCPYHNATGFLVSHDSGETFVRVFDGPILDRIATEPYIAVTPCVVIESGVWRMWYASGSSWVNINGRYEPVYVIKHAHSPDGISWVRPYDVCIHPESNMEAFARPCVIKTNGDYRMWYCFRNSHDYRGGKGSYRLGYAESQDGNIWRRMDNAAECRVTESDWDNEMQCYPYVVEIDGKRFLYYNGNGFGRTGFGLAEWVND